jgi:hypothetical protein
MSFKSLVNKLVKEGKSREAATKIAGKVANAKMKGAGSGPTAKQKARMKKGSPNKMKDLSGDGKITKKDVLIGRGVLKKDGSPAKRKVTKTKKTYSLGKTAGEMVAKKKTVTKKDGSVKTIDKYKTKGGGKGKTKSRVVEKMESAAGGKTTIKSKTRNKRYSSKAIPKKRVTKIEGTTKYNVGPDKMTEFKTTSRTVKKSPTKMKKQGYNARLDDSLGAKHGKKSQSLKSRRDESEGMEKSMGKRKFSGNKSSAQGSPAKMNGNGKKVKGSYTQSTKRKKISGTKTVSPKKGNYLTTKMVNAKTGEVTSSVTKPAKTKKITYEQYEGLPHKEAANARAAQKMGYMMNYNTGQYEPTPNKRGAERRKESGLNRFQAYDQMDTRNAAQTAGSPMGMYGKHSPANAYGKSPMNAYGKSPMKMAHGKSPMKMKAKGGCAISKHMGGRIGGRR